MPEEVYRFSEGAIEAATGRAAEFGQEFDGRSLQGKPAQDSTFSIRAECLDVKVGKKGVCVGLPFGLGDVCIPIPVGIDLGTAAKACLDIYYKTVFGIKLPAGVEVTIYVAGQQVAKVRFGL